MPSLFRFLMIAGMLGALVAGGLYILAVDFEPERREVSKPVSGVRIKRP